QKNWDKRWIVNIMNYVATEGNDPLKKEVLGQKKQEKALREFKSVLRDLVFLLRSASDMQTVYLYWVNRAREQFVLETQSTSLENVIFKDRLSFEEHFLQDYKNNIETLTVEVGEELKASQIKHYYDEVPVKYVTMLPFVNNEETVAITVLESEDHGFTEDQNEVIHSYIDALHNVLNTYMGISDLYEKQDEWIDYESCLGQLDIRCHRAQMIKRLLNIMQEYMHDGGVSFVAQGMDVWCNVMNADEANNAPAIGLAMDKHSVTGEAIRNKRSEFAIHFNNSPKQLSPREHSTDGATLAIPLMMNGRQQGAVLAYDKNALIFKESTKHKLSNLVRVAGLQIMANDPSIGIDQPVLTTVSGAYLPDIWRSTVDAELEERSTRQPAEDSWFGLITLSNLAELRTKMRMEQLEQMQQDLVSTFNPCLYGYNGILGYHSDYLYTF